MKRVSTRYLFFLFIVLLILLLSIVHRWSTKEEEGFQNKPCAFCIPLHPKHFHYGHKIVDELKSNAEVDVYFIFTDIDDKELFSQNLPTDDGFHYLLLTDFGNVDKIKEHNCFPSMKKLYALSVLYKKYKFISCIDAEVTFLKKTNLYEMMENASKNEIICGGDISDDRPRYQGIIQDSLTRVVPPSDIDTLKTVSQNYSIYTWWSNLPVCDTSKVPVFLDWIQFNNSTFIDKMNWNVFDDLLYNYFLIIKYNYKLYVVPNLSHSLEYANSSTIEKVDQDVCKIYWVSKSAYNENKNYYDNNNFYIIFHLDR